MTTPPITAHYTTEDRTRGQQWWSGAVDLLAHFHQSMPSTRLACSRQSLTVAKIIAAWGCERPRLHFRSPPSSGWHDANLID
ncbi:hypothetical protein J6590_045914 [Homalodisca vitripennis]|nr:hypothetical protein J6590_045914 [Homalodisca vitripennis]